jgi:putative DNA primase/helicase
VPDEELNPDVERFFEDKHFVPALAAKEMMQETRFLTQTIKGLIYRYNSASGIYEPDGEDYIAAEAAKKLGKHYSIKREKEIEAFIRASTVAEIPEAAKYLVAVKNGVLDVRTKELKPFNPDFHIFNALPVTYDPDAQCPVFNRFLPEVVPSATDRKVLQEHGGYLLLKDCRFQKALMLTGNTQNGKGTFLYVLEAMLGKKNTSALPLQILSNSNFRFYISQLNGKLANICADLPSEKLKETDAFKKLVAGDTVTGEFKYHPAFDFTPYAKLLYSANELPALPKDTEAFLVRWNMIEFPNQFLPGDPRRDSQLKYKLTTPEELSGILNWCLQGLQRLLEQDGFTRGETVEQLEDRWVVEGDSVKAFIERCTQNEIGAKTTKDDVYTAYQEFCKRHKVKPKNKNKFGTEFRFSSQADDGRTHIDGREVRVWLHISIKAEETEDD